MDKHIRLDLKAKFAQEQIWSNSSDTVKTKKKVNQSAPVSVLKKIVIDMLDDARQGNRSAMNAKRRLGIYQNNGESMFKILIPSVQATLNEHNKSTKAVVPDGTLVANSAIDTTAAASQLVSYYYQETGHAEHHLVQLMRLRESAWTRYAEE